MSSNCEMTPTIQHSDRSFPNQPEKKGFAWGRCFKQFWNEGGCVVTSIGAITLGVAGVGMYYISSAAMDLYSQDRLNVVTLTFLGIPAVTSAATAYKGIKFMIDACREPIECSSTYRSLLQTQPIMLEDVV